MSSNDPPPLAKESLDSSIDPPPPPPLAKESLDSSIDPPPPPPLAKEILEVIVSSFLPSREPTSFQLTVDAEALRDKPKVLSRLLTENGWEKAALAEIYEQHVIRASRIDSASPWARIWRHASQKPPAIFIESGSTCVYVSELLRRFAARERNNIRLFPLGTNNHLTAWLFLNRHLHLESPLDENVPALVPYLFAGRLESKYHGNFPFYGAKNEDYGQEERNEESKGYAQLRLSLARSDLLLLAASRLSLKYGPLVGSRQNAIFKNACYNACVSPIDGSPTKEIHLFITVQKLVAHNTDNQAKVPPPGVKAPADPGHRDFAGFHTWKEELNKILKGKCFPAFDLPLDEDGSLPLACSGEHSLVQSPFSTDLIPDHPQRLRDGTSAVEMGYGRFRICHTWQELFTKAHLTVKVFVAFQGSTSPSDPYFEWIKTEVDAVTKSFATCGIGIDLQPVGTLKPQGSSCDFSLALIQIGPGSNT